MLSFIYFNYRLPFPSIGYYLRISSYLASSTSQYKVTITILGRQFTILLYQKSGGPGTGNHRCSPLFWFLDHNTPLSTDKTSRMCIFFLQSTPQQNWIILSEYHNRSELIRFLSRFPCSCQNTWTEQYNFVNLVQCYNSTKYWLYIKLYTTKHDTNNAITYKNLN